MKAELSAQAAVAWYLLTFALPVPWDIGLIGLALLGAWTAWTATPCFSLLGLCLLPLALAIALGNFISPDPERSLHLSLALLPACLIHWLVGGYFGPRQVASLCLWLALMVCALGGWLLVMAVSDAANSPQAWIQHSRLTAFKVPNDVVLFQILLPFLLASLKWQPKLSLPGWVTWAAIGIAVLVGVAYQSRLAVLVAASSIAAFFLLQQKATSLLPAVLSLAVGILLADAVFGFQLATKFATSWTSRLPLWLAAWRMFLASPWIGHGVGSYALQYREYLDLTQLPAWIALDPRLAPWAHNLYLEVLAELGMLGMFGLLALLWLPFVRSKSSQHPLACAAKAAWFSFCLSGFFELSLWRQWVGLTCLLIIGCLEATNKPKGDSHENFEK